MQNKIVGLQRVVYLGNDREHVFLLRQRIALIDRAVEVNGKVWNLEQRVVKLHQFCRGVERIAASDDDSAGKRQWTVKPSVENWTAIHLGVEFYNAVFSLDNGIWLYAETW